MFFNFEIRFNVKLIIYIARQLISHLQVSPKALILKRTYCTNAILLVGRTTAAYRETYVSAIAVARKTALKII